MGEEVGQVRQEGVELGSVCATARVLSEGKIQVDTEGTLQLLWR